MDFCTLAMLIIGSWSRYIHDAAADDGLDDIYFPIPRTPVMGILGGAGSYAVLGARLFRVPPDSRLVSWTVHTGSDFPVDLRQEIDSWRTSCNFIDTPGRLTTRALNIYGEDEYRGFEYKTPKMRVDHTMLTEEQMLAKCFHLVCAPARCMQLVNKIAEARSKILRGRVSRSDTTLLEPVPPPIFVWEPVPDSCCPAEYANMLETLNLVDVISPNHHELAAFFGARDKLGFSEASDFAIMESQCNELLAKWSPAKVGTVVVRRGDQGCYVASKLCHTAVPAYHLPWNKVPIGERESWQQRVIDPTGGGNMFLGGFCVGLLEDPPEGRTSYENAAFYGSVAASFAIEQVGMPKLSHADDGAELWNGEAVEKRLLQLRKRTERNNGI